MAEPWIPFWLLQIIIASAGATISGSVLLLIHHFRVKQELEIHRKKDVFERKQKVYRSLLRNVSALMDFTSSLGKNVNWRISREIYNELILTGSNTVIEAHNKFTRESDTSDDKKYTELVKSMWIAVRKDLYEESLSPKDMRFFGGSNKTLKVYETYGKYREKIRPLGIENYESIAQMNVDEIHSQTNIDKTELEFMKKQCLKEVEIEKEWKIFIEKHEI